ncbi:hypothetical protein [Butyrivibrio sp. VCB2001]|uniref:hypothetical protein n=1 Tax=Butyrivibrio sp. VCB2001 TaxID=1280667 RepID=UPI00040ED26F|nr:hypothetical protein [Butyrivibrio sp. VCB2001]
MRTLSALCGCAFDKYIWFANNSGNGLYRIEVEKHNVDFVMFFPGEEMEKPFLFKRCLNYKHYLIFVPENAVGIHVFDTSICEFVKVVKIEDYFGYDGAKFSEAFVVEDKMWLFPFGKRKPILLAFNLESMELEECHPFEDAIRKYIDSDTGCLLTRAFIKDGVIYTNIYDSNSLIKWDIQREQMENSEIPVDHIFGVYKSDGGIWINQVNGADMFLWNPINGLVKKYTSPYYDSENKHVINKIMEIGDAVYAIPSMGEHILMISDKSEYDIESIANIADLVSFNNDIPKMLEMIVYKHKLWLLTLSGGVFFNVDLENNEVNRIKLPDSISIMDYESKKKVLLLHTDEMRDALKGVFYETESVGVDVFVQYITKIGR